MASESNYRHDAKRDPPPVLLTMTFQGHTYQSYAVLRPRTDEVRRSGESFRRGVSKFVLEWVEHVARRKKPHINFSFGQPSYIATGHLGDRNRNRRIILKCISQKTLREQDSRKGFHYVKIIVLECNK
jgi:hypothetical protein